MSSNNRWGKNFTHTAHRNSISYGSNGKRKSEQAIPKIPCELLYLEKSCNLHVFV